MVNNLKPTSSSRAASMKAYNSCIPTSGPNKSAPSENSSSDRFDINPPNVFDCRSAAYEGLEQCGNDPTPSFTSYHWRPGIPHGHQLQVSRWQVPHIADRRGSLYIRLYSLICSRMPTRRLPRFVWRTSTLGGYKPLLRKHGPVCYAQLSLRCSNQAA